MAKKEKQDYKETKMFHDVPKRVGDKPAETPKTEEAKPAPAPAPTPAPAPAPAPDLKITPKVKRKSGQTTFSPPSLEQLKSYCCERKNNVDPQKFLDFYESKGWLIGQNKMKFWQAAVRTWEGRDNGSPNGRSNQGSDQPRAEPGKYAKLRHGEKVCMSDDL